MSHITRRTPLLMMRTRSLHGPFFGYHVGARKSRPLAHSSGAAFSAGIIVAGLGPELIVNGGFDADSNWTKGTGWTIAGGVAVGAAGSASALTQGPIALNQGEKYVVIFTVVTVSAGGVAPNVGATLGTLRTAIGTYEESIIAGAASAFIIDKNATFVGTIDNISLREVIE